jgi:hypothetical protein
MNERKKGNSVVTHRLTEDGKIAFSVVGAGEFVFDPAGCSDDTERSAALHGYVQKISDKAAIGRDPETGASATPEEKFAAMKECAERLQNGGLWNAVRESGTGAEGGILFQAMRRLYPQAWATKAAFAEYLEGKAASESERLKKAVTVANVRNGLLSVRKIASVIETIRAEAGKGVKVDAAGMLQELE